MHETLAQWECLRVMILDGPKHSHSFFFEGNRRTRRKTLLPEPFRSPILWRLRSFLFFYFPPLFPFFDYFPCPIFFIHFFHIWLQKYQYLSLKLLISLILSCTAILWGFFRFRHRHFLFSTIRYGHVLFFGLSAPLSFVFFSRSQNTYCLMVCISEYVSEDKLFMCRI